MRFGFVGPMSLLQSPLANCEQLVNFRLLKSESPNARVPFFLVGTSGLALFANLSQFAGVNLPSVRGLYTAQGRTFAVAGTHLLELTANGGVTDYGGTGGNNNIVDDGLPAQMVDGGTVGGNYPSQLLISSGGTLSVFSLVSNTFQALTTPPTNILAISFLNGFFIALSAGNVWSVSNPEDATTWPGISVSQVSVFSDQLLSLIATNELLWVFGATRAVGYYNSGAPLFPFDVYSGAFMEIGIAAQNSPARVTTRQGTTICWLGGDQRGAGVVYAANGLIPSRVSDGALEYWLSQNKGQISDAVGMARQEEGQNFYDLWFPSANAMWTLDVDLGFWHRQTSLINGVQAAKRYRCHTYNAALGGHLVGDQKNGNVYLMDSSYYTDNATPIIRTRIGPTIQNEGGQIPIAINEFQIDLETGVGPIPPLAPLTDGAGNPRDPLAMLSYSENFGKTFTPERVIPCGRGGQFDAVVIDRRLGAWRSWTPKLVVSDPIAWRIADAYTNGTQDQKPRWAKSIAQIA